MKLPSPERIKKLSHTNIRLVSESVVFGDSEYKAGGTCGPRIQNDYQIVFIHYGSLQLRWNQKQFELLPGQGILLSPLHQEFFQFSKTTQTRHSWCSIIPRFVPNSLRKTFQSNLAVAPFSTHSTQLMQIGLNSPPNYTDPLDNQFRLSLGLSLMCHFAQNIQTRSTTKSRADIVRDRIKTFINNHYSEKISLSQLAQAGGVSRQHLLKLFREQEWPTPMETLYTIRLERSLELLLHTGLSIAEIAYRCGFENPFHFSRRFKNLYQKSPKQMRKEA